MDNFEDMKRVLIVDDEVDFAVSLMDILESRGYAVRPAHSIDEALAAAADFQPLVALVDIRLGRESGIGLLASLKRDFPALITVIMTAYASTETAVEALHEGAYDYLRKPIDFGDLFATLDRCLERAKLRRERDQATVALEDRNRELAEINQRLRMMVESARDLASCHDISQFNNHLLEEFARIMAAEGGALFMVREDGLELIHALQNDTVPGFIPFPLRERSVLARVMEEKTHLLVRDITEENLESSGWNGYRDGSLYAMPLVTTDGEVLGVITLHNKKWPPFTDQDRELGKVMLSLTSEILKSQQAAQRIRNSLREKEVLLKEIHHRVKNNLQVISGLINLQAQHVEDHLARDIFRDSQNRVVTMALIHEKLYQAADLANVNFTEFITDLTANLLKSLSDNTGRVSLDLQLEDVTLVVDTAIPCGLIINELISNCLGHAFPDGREGTIRVELKNLEDNTYYLSVGDDGVGLPAGLDPARAASMGMQVVTILINQLGSELEFSREAGTTMGFSFREYHEAGTELY